MKLNNLSNPYLPTIGIECHVQLKTLTKLFSGADNNSESAEPNVNISPLCIGLPGTLPILNSQAIELAIKAGIALNADIALISTFDRKHYFYPDLPKGYQITQLENPIVGKGEIEVPLLDGKTFKVRINRAHLEEDAAKLTHPEGADYSLVDLNRAGTPLIEIVSEPDIHSPQEAKAYVQELYLLMTYAGVTKGNMYYGNMRFDVNISVAKKDSAQLGYRTEIKNLNSFKSVERAAIYEYNRQVEIIQRGEQVVQETRGWDEAKQRTFSQRSKENVHDYRYFPDGDIPPIIITKQHIEEVRDQIKDELPLAIRQKLKQRGLPFKDVATLFSYPFLLSKLLEIYNEVNDKEFKQISDLLINVLAPEIDNVIDYDPNSDKLLSPSGHLVNLIKLVNGKKVSSSAAKSILLNSWTNFIDPEITAKRLDVFQESDEEAIMLLVEKVLSDPESSKAISDIKNGNDKAIGYLVGQVMKLSQGKANPGFTTQLIRKKIQL